MIEPYNLISKQNETAKTFKKKVLEMKADNLQRSDDNSFIDYCLNCGNLCSIDSATYWLPDYTCGNCTAKTYQVVWTGYLTFEVPAVNSQAAEDTVEEMIGEIKLRGFCIDVDSQNFDVREIN